VSDAPPIEPGDWISVGTVDCLVIELHADDSKSVDADVICNPGRPAVYGVSWSGEQWTFAHPMHGDYAEHHPAADPYVQRFRAGRLDKRH